MTRPVVAAHLRLAFIRGRRLLIIATVFALAALGGTFAADAEWQWLPTLVSLPILLMITIFPPVSAVGMEKVLGHLEFDRTLPVPLRTSAAARLIGTMVGSLPVPLVLVAVAALVGQHAPQFSTTSVALALVVALLACWWVTWLSYALVARFASRKLVYLPGALWLAMVILPETWLDRIARGVGSVSSELLSGAPSLLTLVSVGAAAVAMTALVFAGSTALLANALARFVPDQSLMLDALGSVPKRELSALGRGPALAIARLRLRVSTDQFRREMMFVGALILMILLDVDGISGFGRTYAPFLAALLPPMIAMQLAIGRVAGVIEQLQQLPHPRRVVGFGHLLAVMALSVPAVVIRAVVIATDGVALDPARLVKEWFFFVALGSVMAALAVWGTPRRFLMALGGVIVAPILLIALLGWLLATGGNPMAQTFAWVVQAFVLFGVAAGGLIPIALAILTTIAANELFAYGLATFRTKVTK